MLWCNTLRTPTLNGLACHPGSSTTWVMPQSCPISLPLSRPFPVSSLIILSKATRHTKNLFEGKTNGQHLLLDVRPRTIHSAVPSPTQKHVPLDQSHPVRASAIVCLLSSATLVSYRSKTPSATAQYMLMDNGSELLTAFE